MELNRHSGFKGMILSILLLVFVTLLVVLSIILVRIKLLQNAQDMGMALAQSYAMEEENTLRTLEINLVMAGQYVNEIVANGGSTLDIQNWLAGYFSKLTDIIGEGMVDFYAVIDGRIVAANPWEGDDSFDFSASEWYLQAIEAGGQPVWSDAYQDAITQERIFTISQELERSGDVLAMDVYIQSEALHSTTLNMPDQYSYYLCDQHGQLLYAVTNWNKSISDLQDYANYCMEGIADGSLLPYDASFKDLNGIERGMYYHQMKR